MPLPQPPARVKVTLADGTVGWLADPPEAPIGDPRRWRLVEDRADARVWAWPRALELERAARQPWRRQHAKVEPVNPGPPPVFRADRGDQARVIAHACGIRDADRVAWIPESGQPGEESSCSSRPTQSRPSGCAVAVALDGTQQKGVGGRRRLPPTRKAAHTRPRPPTAGSSYSSGNRRAVMTRSQAERW